MVVTGYVIQFLQKPCHFGWHANSANRPLAHDVSYHFTDHSLKVTGRGMDVNGCRLASGA